MTEQEFRASVNQEIKRMTDIRKDYPEYDKDPSTPEVTTLWDRYAMAALTGLLAAESDVGMEWAKRTADTTCLMADAMMEARAKRLSK